ncbi:MAG: HAMP domain-containing protein [Candidatus Omnitrophica bacterium]|nr:HAMP domain-containing protein [Candidatus Omnitrophota bacterium]
MKIFNSIFMKLILLVALAEFLIMLSYEYFTPLSTLIEKNVFVGPILDTSILVIIIGIIYYYLFKKPLDELIKVMNLIRKGDFSKRANDKSKDEFGEIAVSFNHMTEDLQKSRKEIEEYSKTLEEKVEERTEELRATNEEIKQANEELESTTEQLRVANEEAQKAKEVAEKKAEQLEKFNKVAVGRELKMRELKARIEELEAKLSSKS